MSSLFYHTFEPFHPWFLRYWGMLKQIAISVNILIFGKIIFSSMLLKIRIPPSQWRAHLPTTPRRFHARSTSFILVTNPLPTREQILPKYGAFFHWWNRPWNENTFWMIVQVRASNFDPHMSDKPGVLSCVAVACGQVTKQGNLE